MTITANEHANTRGQWSWIKSCRMTWLQPWELNVAYFQILAHIAQNKIPIELWSEKKKCKLPLLRQCSQGKRKGWGIATSSKWLLHRGKKKVLISEHTHITVKKNGSDQGVTSWAPSHEILAFTSRRGGHRGMGLVPCGCCHQPGWPTCVHTGKEQAHGQYPASCSTSVWACKWVAECGQATAQLNSATQCSV